MQQIFNKARFINGHHVDPNLQAVNRHMINFLKDILLRVKPGDLDMLDKTFGSDPGTWTHPALRFMPDIIDVDLGPVFAQEPIKIRTSYACPRYGQS